MAQPASNQQRVAYNTAAQVIGRVITGILGVVAISLSTRYLGLSGYGQLTTGLIFVGLFTAVSDAGTATIAVRELVQSKRPAASIVGNILLLRSALGVIAVAAAIGLGYLIYPGAPNQPIRLAIELLSLTLLLTTVSDAMTATLLANLRNDLLVVGDILGRLVSLGLVIAAVHWQWGFAGLVWATLAGAIANFISDCSFGSFALPPDLRPDFSYMKMVLLVSAPVGAGAILNSVYFKADGLMLSLFKGSAEVGLYGVAYKVVELTMAFPIFFMAAVFPLVSAAADDSKRLRAVTAKAARILNITGAPIVAGSIALAPQLVRVLGGRDFAGAAGPMMILMLANYLVYNGTAYSAPLLARNLQSKTLIVIGGVLIINIAVNLIAIPLAGTVGAAWTVVLSEVVALGLLRHYFRRHIGLPPSLTSNLGYIACAGIMAAILVVFRPLIDRTALAYSLPLAVVAGGGIYGALVLGTKQYKISELKELLAR